MTDLAKIRVLVVHSQLAQHGSERYMYEICRALNQDRFDVTVLTRPFFIRDQFYYHEFTKLGVPIHCRLVTRRHLRFPIKWLYSYSAAVRGLVRWTQQRLVRWLCRPLVESADIIVVIGVETYCDAFAPWLDKRENVVIHHMNHNFQFERDYFAECRQRHIVIFDEQQRMEISASPLRGCEMFHFPLSMSLLNRAVLPVNTPSAGKPVRFAVVSRLYKDRPNEPLFRCFAALTREINAELYFYGGGDASKYTALLRELGISDKVVFKGHESNLEKAFSRDQPSIFWLVSMGPTIGYGSVEVASLGLPMVFWDLSQHSYEEILRQTDGAMHAFSTIEEFARFNLELLQDPVKLQHCADQLCRHVRTRFEISRYIKKLECYYEDVAMRANQSVNS
ncbi:MAG: glycosyltransferase [Verrucomicrobiota bacterium]